MLFLTIFLHLFAKILAKQARILYLCIIKPLNYFKLIMEKKQQEEIRQIFREAGYTDEVVFGKTKVDDDFT